MGRQTDLVQEVFVTLMSENMYKCSRKNALGWLAELMPGVFQYSLYLTSLTSSSCPVLFFCYLQWWWSWCPCLYWVEFWLIFS